MTDPTGPPAAAGGSPTPEEISARLEALLKRTHALRAQQAPAGAGGPLGVAWPPPDRELDRYDVVDVEGSAAASMPGRTSSAQAAPDFARPDWDELRLRTAGGDSTKSVGWTSVLLVVLALIAAAEGVYIWYLQATRPALVQGRLLVDEPEGAEVRVDGHPVGVAPLEHTLDPGQYEIELVDRGRTVRAERVIVGLGRTVMLLAPDGAAPPESSASSAVRGAAGTGPAGPALGSAPPVPPAAARAPAPAAAAAAAALVSATTGAVSIESTPTGLPVTMGGRPRGMTPLTVGQLAPGRHDVLVGGAARRVDVQVGQVTTLRVSR